ncbi:MAG: hypothetical protein AAFX01_10025 [Cyanobacteria bacterium J06638_28]
MQELIRYGAILALLGLSACGPSVKTQCQEMGEVTQQAMDKYMEAARANIGTSGYQASTEVAIAEALTESATAMAALSIRDRELQAVQADLVSAYQAAATAHTEMAELIPANGSPSTQRRQAIDTIRTDAEAGIPPAIQALTVRCVGL